MNEDSINVSSVSATAIPVSNQSEEDVLKQVVREAASTIGQVMDSFSDEVPETESKKATSFLHNFMDYIKGSTFKDDINSTAKKYGIPPKKLAQNFFERALGTVGDVLGIAINTAGNAAHMLIDILSTVLHGGINLIAKVANALASIVTLNKTCVAA